MMKQCVQCNDEGLFEFHGTKYPCNYCLTGRLQAELNSLKAEKGMGDMGFVSIGASKKIDELQAEIEELKAELTEKNEDNKKLRNTLVEILCM